MDMNVVLFSVFRATVPWRLTSAVVFPYESLLLYKGSWRIVDKIEVAGMSYFGLIYKLHKRIDKAGLLLE